MTHPQRKQFDRHGIARARGMSLVETMVAMTISLVILLALVSVYVNVARSNEELSKANGLIENGRFSLQMIEGDLVHAGFWDGYLPQFDDLTTEDIPGDAATAVPDPCVPYALWNGTYKTNLVAIPVQTSDTLWAGLGCVSPLVKRAGTDAIAVHYLETCVPGDPGCDPIVAGRVYFQNSTCAAEKLAGTAAGATASTITFTSASNVTNLYRGAMIRQLSGPGIGETRSILSYNGGTLTATVTPNWLNVPAAGTTYALEYVLGTTSFPLHRRDCVGTGVPAGLPVTAGTLASRRRYVSNIYYVTDVVQGGQTVPTLVRSQFSVVAGTPRHAAPERLIDGVEMLRVELGIDDVSETGEAVDFSVAIDWDDPATKATPKNRGDGSPDRFVRCTTATPCTPADLMNAVAVKIWVLARSRDQSLDYVDAKDYCLGTLDASGDCPADSIVAAADVEDNYKRHVFSTSVRMVNVSGRRETPFP
jgi:type II secretory pathway pseudopilin PulG